MCIYICYCDYKEAFLDISVTVAGSTGLAESLAAAFVDKELLHDKNKYNCSNCAKLTNANKVRVFSLVSILKQEFVEREPYTSFPFHAVKGNVHEKDYLVLPRQSLQTVSRGRSLAIV